tara:strand:- start:4174 stop:5334 length:1161 start_codon:yes stop_codon:yes gene_type:complete
MTTPLKPKTVYILGAGFSAPAGGPDQSRLLEKIFDLKDPKPKVKNAQKALRKFLIETMRIAEDEFKNVQLEDIYTPIDRCIADNIHYRGHAHRSLRRLAEQLDYLISLAIEESFRDGSNSSEYVNQFAQHLVDHAYIRSQKAQGDVTADEAKAYDPFSIISLNWDILLDQALYQKLEIKDGYIDGDYEPIGVVDYCCYISSIDPNNRRIRTGLWALGSRGYNVKLLKIHGSMNWLQCPNCQQLFVSFNQKENIPNYLNPKECRHCSENDIQSNLRGSMIMPTFLKDLSNFQLKLIWQNTAVELMEARNLVFIGYSLPQADFEFRQLISRTIHPNTTVHVVLFKGKNKKAKLAYEEECDRYRQFFGKRKVTFEPKGVEEYVTKLCNG